MLVKPSCSNYIYLRRGDSENLIDQSKENLTESFMAVGQKIITDEPK